MPTLTVSVKQGSAERCINLGDALSAVMKEQFPGHNCDVFISEYVTHLYNGTDCDAAEIELVAAMDIPEEKMASLMKDVCIVMRETLSDNRLRIIFSYVQRQQSYLGVNGETLKDIYNKKK